MTTNADAPAVVLVEDDPHIADLIDMYLRQDGFRVYQATTGERALEQVRDRQPMLVVLDLGLAGDIDGMDVCRALRSDCDVAIIMVTARDGEQDRIAGLELGADDYLTKPFSPRELVARVRAILRRTEARPNDRGTVGLRAGDVVVDETRREATVAGVPVALAAREFDLLAHLARNPGVALTRRRLIDAVWGIDWEGDERTVDVHVRQLRRKLGDALPLTTVWGTGYRLD